MQVCMYKFSSYRVRFCANLEVSRALDGGFRHREPGPVHILHITESILFSRPPGVSQLYDVGAPSYQTLGVDHLIQGLSYTLVVIIEKSPVQLRKAETISQAYRIILYRYVPMKKKDRLFYKDVYSTEEGQITSHKHSYFKVQGR